MGKKSGSNRLKRISAPEGSGTSPARLTGSRSSLHPGPTPSTNSYSLGVALRDLLDLV